MNWYLSVLKNYAQFSGRARRKEYWMFVLFNAIASVVAFAIDGALGIQIVSLVYMLATIIPSIAVSIRRLHDTNRSGWWLLLSLVPLANIVVFVFMCFDSTPGSNQYGANPKETALTQV